ncbi:Protoheme IX farnesyltransferase 2 [Paraliobacillus sp. PM-2]|uniref:heme o synthase n=1 Tax=Paraliobacillus sp. PM-2 TaxID=1462524 RepID=UPI00061CD05D|nr:heme o synthase [Paraliobacillus sp. PM-2]CQR46360.1 Protoheme IX farnesyltransferase 2 [Paraliobacillus sp. PM-2]
MKQLSTMSTPTTKSNETSFLQGVKALFKGLVLVSNILPVLAGITAALYTNQMITQHPLLTTILTLLGTTCVIAGALVFNNWYDADIDAVMKRTMHRPTVTGQFSLSSVFNIAIILSVLGFILLSFTTLLAVIFALIGWITYVFLYTMWSKRRYTWNTIIGSVSGAVTPLIGWFAITSELSLIPFAMVLILFLWQMPHTYVIAIKKYNEYKIAGVKMLPVTHGIATAKRRTTYYLASLIPSSLMFYPLSPVFTIIAVLMASIGLIIAVTSYVNQKDDWKWANRIFLFSVNYIMFLFIGIVITTFILY